MAAKQSVLHNTHTIRSGCRIVVPKREAGKGLAQRLEVKSEPHERLDVASTPNGRFLYRPYYMPVEYLMSFYQFVAAKSGVPNMSSFNITPHKGSHPKTGEKVDASTNTECRYRGTRPPSDFRCDPRAFVARSWRTASTSGRVRSSRSTAARLRGFDFGSEGTLAFWCLCQCLC